MNSRNLYRCSEPTIREFMIRALLVAAFFTGALCSTRPVQAMPTVPMHFSHISIEDGLSQNNVQAILQDSTGFMWFATESGLNKYDGHQIHRYNRERGNPSGMANDFVWVIAEDGDQNLWLATQGGGVVRWNRQTDTFDSFRHDPENPNSLASDNIRTLLVNADGTIWVGTRDSGLDLLNPQTGEAQHFRHDSNDPLSLSNDSVYALRFDSLGRLWVGTDGGLNRLNADSGYFVRYQNDPSNAQSLSDNRVRTIFEDQARTLWVGTATGGLNRLDTRTGGFSHFRNESDNPNSLSGDNIRVIFEDDANRFWIGTANGLNLLDRKSGSVDRYHHDPRDSESLNDSYINSIYQDRSGLLWIGTRSAGLNSWNPRSWSLGHYTQPWLSDADITSFADNGNGEFWVGTLGAGLARIDKETYAVGRLMHRSDDPNSISDDRVMSLLLDRQGMLWIGTMAGGLNRLDTQTGEIRVFRRQENDPASISANGVMSIFEASDGRIWVGTYGGGVSVYNRETASFTRYENNPEDLSSLSDQRASAILQDRTGAIWVSTFGGGLNRFNAESGTFQRYQHVADDPASLSDNMVYALHLDRDGNIWVGTAAGGLDRVIEPEVESGAFRFQNFSQRDGLPSNVVYGIQSDADNNLWLSSNFGLSRFSTDTLAIKTFHVGHGLQGEEFNYAAHHRAPDGKIYFGGANGFNAFYPDRVEESGYEPKVVLTSFQIHNQPVATDVPFDHLDLIELTHRDHVVNFEFAALDFTAPSKNKYSYKLEGFDESWVDLGEKHYVTFTNLNAGTYTLKVSAVTSDGVSTGSAYSIPMTVAPAPWLSPLAYILYAGLAIMVLWFIWNLQRRKYRREAEYSRKLEQDVALRTEQLNERNKELEIASHAKSNFLARMSHEIRTPMNGMLGMTQLLMGTELDDKQFRFTRTIKKSAESLLNIINDILDFSKIEAGHLALDKVEFDISDLVEDTVELFSGAASEKGLELLCSTPPGRTTVALGDPMRLKQILVNLLGNAVKFTQDGEVLLRYSLVENDGSDLNLRFEVSDTGVGIQQSNLSMIFDSFSQEDGSTSRRFGGTGLGLAICKQLAEMMDGEIGVESEPGKGSTFWFTVTLEKAGAIWFPGKGRKRLADLKVLIAADNATNSEIISGYLSAFGIKAITATSHSTALQRLRNFGAKESPDVILVDAKARDSGGLELTREIRSQLVNQSFKIVLMTPADADLSDDQWRDAGVDICLPKPIRQSALYECLLMMGASPAAFIESDKMRRTDDGQLERLSGRILLVEDNPVNQAVAVGMIDSIGCDTVVAINGRDAIDKVTKDQFDLVLMDCEMPVMDGFAATAAIRALDIDQSDIPIVALTANAVAGDRNRCLSAGMQDYISKPVSVEKLHALLSKWLPTNGTESANGVTGGIDSSCLDKIRDLRGIGGDNMVKQVVNLYVSNSSMLIEDLRAGLRQGDAEAVRQGAHALKSSSQNVGARGLALLSQKLEELGRVGELDDVQEYITRLEDLYPKTVSALQSAVVEVEKC